MARNRIDKIYEVIGLKIRNKRHSIDISQEDLAKLADLKRPSIVLVESGRQKLPIDRLYVIARALECSPKELLPEANEIFEDESKLEIINDIPITGHGLDPNGELKIREFLKKENKKRGAYATGSNPKKSSDFIKRTRG